MIPIDKKIRVLTIQFDAEISSKEIVWFRGTVLKSLGDKADLLYHNHIEDKTSPPSLSSFHNNKDYY